MYTTNSPSPATAGEGWEGGYFARTLNLGLSVSVNNHTKNFLTNWYRQPLGQYIYLQECKELAQHLPQLSGTFSLQLGLEQQTDWLHTNNFRHQLTLAPTVGLTPPPLICSLYTQLPVADESIDLMFLPHTLEATMAAQTVLAEAWRAVAAEGHLLILGFNPWSCWNFLHTLSGETILFPPLKRIYGLQKIRRWLLELGAKITVEKFFCSQLPSISTDAADKKNLAEKVMRHLPATNNLYLIMAQKQIIPFTPVEVNWRWENTLSDTKGMAEPTAGRLRRDQSS